MFLGHFPSPSALDLPYSEVTENCSFWLQKYLNVKDLVGLLK